MTKKKKEREARQDDKRAILSKRLRMTIYVFGILYLLITLLSVFLLKRNRAGFESYFMI